MKKAINYSFVLLFSAYTAGAQDFHLSQYDMATQYLNPAMTGMYGGETGDYRIYSDYRSQWQNASLNPYTTAYLAYDMSAVKWNKDLGLGAYFVNSSSGISSLNSFNLMLSAAYNITGNSQDIHELTTGIQMGIIHKGFDPDNFTYDSQYSEALGGFDTGLPSGENYSRSSITGFDANYGIYYKYIEKGKLANPFGGFSIYHLTRPNESFTSTESKMPMRFNLHGGCDLSVDESLKLTPRFLYMSQAKSNEFNLGLLTSYAIANSPYSALLQLDYRNGDAFIMGLGIKQNQHIFRITYDMNSSSLNNYANSSSSWEVSLLLTGIKGKSLFGKSSE